MSVQGSALAGVLRILPLPSLPPVVVEPATKTEFDGAADALLAGAAPDLPARRLDFLRWLAENRPVVFHGSPRDDLIELSTERKSTDTTKWGNQQAVYASSDPVWAIYFACLRRDNGWTGSGLDRSTSCRPRASWPTRRWPAQSTRRTSFRTCR
jgi:hypothetical protein